MLTRLTDRIWIVKGGKNGRYPYSHSLYIRDGGGVLVDAGSDPAEIERLRTEDGISTVVMTHYHEDHFTFLSRLPDAEVWASAPTPRPSNRSKPCSPCTAAWERMGTPSTGSCSREIPLRPQEGRPPGGRRGGAPLRENAGGRRGRPRPLAGPPVPPFPRRGDPLPRGLRPDGVRPVVRGRAVRDRGFPPLRPPPGGDRGGPVRGLPRGAGPPGPDRGKVEEYLSAIDRRDEALRESSREPRTRAEIIARRLIYGPGRLVVARLRRVVAPLEAPRGDDPPRGGGPPRRRLRPRVAPKERPGPGERLPTTRRRCR